MTIAPDLRAAARYDLPDAPGRQHATSRPRSTAVGSRPAPIDLGAVGRRRGSGRRRHPLAPRRTHWQRFELDPGGRGRRRRLSLRWSGESGPTSTAGRRPITAADIIIVAPYNAQVAAIEAEARSRGITPWVGTVDKFQGQEGAVAHLFHDQLFGRGRAARHWTSSTSATGSTSPSRERGRWRSWSPVRSCFASTVGRPSR